MENEDLLKQATLGKRVFAFLIDFLLAFILGTFLSSFVTGVYMFDAMGGNKYQQESYTFAKDSGLVNFTKDDDGNIQSIFLLGYDVDGKENTSYSLIETPNKVPGYEAYLDIVWNYYTVFYPTDSRMVKPEGYVYDATDYDSYKGFVYKNVFLLPDPALVKDKTDAIRYSSDDAHPYFEYALKEDGTPDIASKPVLREKYVSIIEGSDETKKTETLTTLRNYFLNIDVSSGTPSVNGGIYYNAVLDMEGSSSSIQTYYKQRNIDVQWLLWECSLTATMPLYFILFFLIPVIDKQGRTLGKFILRLSVVREDAVLVKPLQRIGRPLFMLILVSLTLLPNSSWSMLAFGACALIDFAFLAFSKKGAAIHDRLFKTTVVSTKESTYFSNYDDKEEYLASLSSENAENEQENARILLEDSIIDSSTINARREEARKITSFDEFEKEKDEEHKKREESNPANKVNLHKDDEE